MQEKFNNATPQRPAGARPLDGELILADLPRFIKEIRDEAAYRENGKNAITVFKSEHATTTLLVLKEGEKVQSAGDEKHLLITLYIIEGDLSFVVNQKEDYLSVGQLLSYHYGQAFQVLAHSECICLLTVIK
ncbi:cupin domain-containing protein [Pedobacter helvus]|uniref:Uncharacterized protein n=1 Tax=Pedobacter helvus TaxID=2563444 RepID=A0ABW9JKB1_9SPHI|nr:hypothetical protein [Pedobacter ureilyticus]